MAESSIKHCIDAAKESLDQFTSLDIERYVTDVINKAREYTDIGRQAAIERAIKEVGNQRAQTYLEEMQRSVVNQQHFDKLSQKIIKEKTRLLDLVARRWKNMSDNIESRQRASRKLLMNQFLNILKPEETKFILNPRNSIEVMRALDGKDAGDIAKGIADKFKKYIEVRNAMEVNSGSLLLENVNKDRVLRAIHDASKLLLGGRNLAESAFKKRYSIEQSRNIWREYIKPLLNLKETFRDTDAIGVDDEIDMGKVDTYLNQIFDNITGDKPELFAIGKKQKMFFYWKDNESWMNYNSKYGKGSLYDAMLADTNASANRVGMAGFFGSNPEAMFNKLALLEQEHNPDFVKDQPAAKRSFMVAAGINNAPIAPRLTSFFNAIRSLTGTARLAGRLTILSLPDIANGISFAERHGYSYFKAYGTYLTGLFNAIPSAERKYLAQMFKEMTDTHLGFMGRYMDANSTGNVIDKFNNSVYKLTLMTALDKGNKISALQIMSRMLGDNAKFAYEKLNDSGRALLDKFNINPNEWEALRNNTVKFGKHDLITLDSVDNLSNEDLHKIYSIDDDRPLHQLRQDLHNKVYSMFDVASENTVLTPGLFMKGNTRIGNDIHPFATQILKSIMQFKMYPLEFIDRVLYQGFKTADGVQNKLRFAALLAGATLPMSWLSLHLDNISRGKTDANWDRMSLAEKGAYAINLLLPGVGMMATFLEPDNQNPNIIGKFFTTPATRLLGEMLYTPFQLAETAFDSKISSRDKKKKIKTAFKNLAESVIPGQGMPFLSPYMREMFGDKPYLLPGQKQKFGS